MAAVPRQPWQPSEGFPGQPSPDGLERLRQPRNRPGSGQPRNRAASQPSEAMAAVLRLPGDVAEGFPCLDLFNGLERLRMPRSLGRTRIGDVVPILGDAGNTLLGGVPELGTRPAVWGTQDSRTGDTTRIGDRQPEIGDAGILDRVALPENARPYPSGRTLPERAGLPYSKMPGPTRAGAPYNER